MDRGLSVAVLWSNPLVSWDLIAVSFLFSLFSNHIGEAGTQSVKELLAGRGDLKVVMKITDDERVLDYMEETLQRLETEMRGDGRELVSSQLQNLGNEIAAEGNLHGQTTEKAQALRGQIAQVQMRVQNRTNVEIAYGCKKIFSDLL